MADYHWQIYANPDEVAVAACGHILNSAKEAINQHGQFKIVLAGGTTPEKVYRLLAESKADWGKWWIYHGDERCLPIDHKDRNSLLARSVWLDKVNIPANQIFNIPAELGPEQGARLYADIVESALPFDLVLLGMGEDGHTASLFPGHVHDENALTHAVYNSPKPPPERVSLSAKALSSTGQVLFLITGANKRKALRQWRSGADLPVASVHCPHTTLYVDEDANSAD